MQRRQIKKGSPLFTKEYQTLALPPTRYTLQQVLRNTQTKRLKNYNPDLLGPHRACRTGADPPKTEGMLEAALPPSESSIMGSESQMDVARDAGAGAPSSAAERIKLIIKIEGNLFHES